MTAPEVVIDAPAPVVTPPEPVAAPVVAAPPVVEPAAPPVPAAPVEPAKPEGPLTRREAKRGLHEDLHRKAAEAPAAAPEVRSPDAPSVEVKPLGASETPSASPVETLATPGPASPAVTPAAPALIIIPIPEGHPLREMGVTELVARSPQEERAQRASLNSYTRRQEVATLQAKVDEYERGRVEQEARDAATQKWMARPEYQAQLARYQEIKDAFGEPEAEAWWRGVNAEFDKVAQQEFDTRMGVVDQQRAEQAANAWKNEAWGNVSTLPMALRQLPGFSNWFESSVQSFNAEMQLGHYPQLKTAEDMHREFVRFFQAKLAAQPEVAGVYKSLTEREEQGRTAAAARAAEEQRRIERVKLEAIEEYKRQEAAKRIATPPHPLGNLAAASRDRMPVAGSEAAEPAADLSPNQLKKSLRNAAREDTRRRFGGP